MRGVFLCVVTGVRAFWMGRSLKAAVVRNQAAADALDAVVKEMLKQ